MAWASGAVVGMTWVTSTAGAAPGLVCAGPACTAATPGTCGERAVEPVKRGAVGRGLDLGDHEQRAVEARPEPLGEHFVCLVRVA